jgi:hypothetical protein
VDVWEYFGQKEREFRDYSLAPDGPWDSLFAEEVGSNGMLGRIFGNLRLISAQDAEDALDAFIAINETVVVRGKSIHRVEYSYFLVVDGVADRRLGARPFAYPPGHRHRGPRGPD